jgi:hypothetical protein
MLTYYQRTCDRKGTILSQEKLKARCLQDAMAHVNSRLSSMARQKPSHQFDPSGRIEIADYDGRPVARIYCAEVLEPSRS